MKLHQHSIIRLVKKYIGEPEAGAEIGVHRGGTSAVLRAKFPKCRMFFVDAWKYWEDGESYHNDKMGKNSAEEWAKIKEEAAPTMTAEEAWGKIVEAGKNNNISDGDVQGTLLEELVEATGEKEPSLEDVTNAEWPAIVPVKYRFFNFTSYTNIYSPRGLIGFYL